MTATTVSIDTPRRDGHVVDFGVAATTKVPKGVLTQLASGYLTSMTLGTSLVVAGVSYEEADNSAGGNGDIRCKVYRTGIFEFNMASAAITDIGSTVYAADNVTVTKTSTGATAVGKIVAVENTNMAFIDIGEYT